VDVSVGGITTWGVSAIFPISVSLASAVDVASIGILAMAISDLLLTITPINEMTATRNKTDAEGVRNIFLKASMNFVLIQKMFDAMIAG
jgi:hypothetical protein